MDSLEPALMKSRTCDPTTIPTTTTTTAENGNGSDNVVLALQGLSSTGASVMPAVLPSETDHLRGDPQLNSNSCSNSNAGDFECRRYNTAEGCPYGSSCRFKHGCTDDRKSAPILRSTVAALHNAVFIIAIVQCYREESVGEKRRWCCMGTQQKVSNFADLIHKVARSCLLHPVGHKFGDRTEPLGAASSSSGDSSDVTTANRDESRHESVEVFPLESGQYENLLQKLQGMEALIADMFDAISSLKSFYVRLQAAHSPYDPERLHEADKAVVAELKRLSDLKQSYRRNKGIFSHQSAYGHDHNFEEQKKIFEAYEDVVKDLRNEVREKNLQIEFLKENLRHSTRRKDKLERRIFKRDGDHPALLTGRTVFECPTPQLFDATMDQVNAASKSFRKLLISLMKNANWDIDAAVSSIEPGITYAKKSYKKYAFQSYVCQKMFHGFENETFYITGSLSSLLEPEKHRRDCFTQFQDMQRMQPTELLNILPDCPFGKFCNKKYLCIIHPKMEEAFFKNLDHRNQVVNGNHPRTHFYENFLRLSKAVWLLHKLAFSFNPVPSHFHVKRDAIFQPMYMESVVPLTDLELQGDSLRVAFAVTPGFKLGDSITKSQVYLVPITPSDSR